MEQELSAPGMEGEPLSAGDLLRGAMVGEYVIDRRIARGGCGAVYDARHAHVARRVAVKVLHAFLAGQPKMVERFLREVELVTLLRHPGIVEILEVGVLADRRPFYVMEYLAGGTLEDLLRDRGRLSPAEALDVLEPVCAALEVAHAAGVVHRDVKPSNIAFDEGRRAVKLLDFGIAKLLSPDAGQAGLTTVGRQLGTPTIMAPEQLQGDSVDARVDIYALGVMLYRMLTGRPPFDGRTPHALARQHLNEPPPRPSWLTPVGPAVDAVVLRCLEKLPERRFASARSFCATFAEALGLRGDGPVSGRVVPARGVGVYVELSLGVTEDDLDDALQADVGVVLDLAEARLQADGFTLAQATGNAVLGVRLLTGDARGLRAAAVATAEAVEAAIGARPGADARLSASVAVHADELLVRPGPMLSLVGGALLCPAGWAAPGAKPTATPTATAGPGVQVTAAAREGLDEGEPTQRALRR